jgi:hypothetical protein
MTSLRLKRGTTIQNNSYTGPPGELTVDTTLNQLRLHNGTTAGGVAISDLTVTSVKTSAYNANVNELVRIDSTTGSFTITLPATPPDGARISFLDVTNQCGTNPVLVAANGKTILGDSTGISLDANGAGLSLVFNNLTNNWSNIDMFSSSMSVVVDLTPNAFNFTDQTGVALSSTITSNTVTITGLSPNVSITVSGSGGTVDAGTSSLSGTFSSSKTVTTSGSGTIVVAGRMSSSGSYNQQTSMTITAGTVSDTWYATTSSGSYIATPASTPAIGDYFEGGYYTGMIWNQLVQSSTSMAIGTGSKSFTVPDMTSSPIVYVGQQLEVRSRANPANNFVGTVTSAAGTSLTINVTSTGGSGTFSDWSIMARYRILVAPKASGENNAIALKNTNDAFPSGCQSLNDGWTATNAMKNAGDATVYPAAWWARGLTINGYNDWYIPARDELELCWRNLKPTTDANYSNTNRSTGQSFNYMINGAYGDTSNQHGVNNNSSPVGNAYTSGSPGQTAVTAFRTGGSEAFNYGTNYYWSSTEFNTSDAWPQAWNSGSPGYQYGGNKLNTLSVRAVRRSII